MNTFLHQLKIETLETNKLEVLGEKALAEGHIDIMIKEAIPIGFARKVIVEVKTGSAKLQDIRQVCTYLDEIGNECLAGIVIARDFPKNTLQEAIKRGINAFIYKLGTIEAEVPVTFEEIKESLQLIKVT